MRKRMRLRRIGRQLPALCLGFSGLLSCNSEPLILLDLDPWPDTGVTLIMHSQLNGAPGMDLTFSNQERRLSVVLPAGSDGTLQLDFSVRDSTGCEIAVASLTEAVPGGLPRADELPVSFALPPPHACVVPSTSQTDLTSVIALTPTTFWGVGAEGTVIRCAGNPAACQIKSSGTISKLNAVYSAGDSFMVAVGDSGALINCDDNSCGQHTFNTMNLTSVWASDSDNIFAVGAGGTMVRCQDLFGACVGLTSPTTKDLTKVYGTDSAHVFAVGAAGAVVACANGTPWTCTSRPNTMTVALTDIAGINFSSVSAIGASDTLLTCNTTSCQPTTFNTSPVTNLTSLYVPNANTVWAVGSGGVIARCLAAGCSQVASGTTQDLKSVWGFGLNTIFAVGTGGTMVRCDDGGCTVLNTGTTQDLTAVHGTDLDHVYAVGKAGTVVRFQP